MSDVIVREARAGEFAAIDALLAAVYVEGGYIPAGERVSEGAAERAAHAVVLVAIDDVTEELLGSATVVTGDGPAVRMSLPGEAEIRLVGVAPPARGRGAGEALTRVCVERARRADCSRVVLATLPAMEAAQRLYERLGFVRAPSRDHAGPSGDSILAYELAL
jgi:ribosomal protein S18 acetylase RimI-like enzyme